MRNMLTIPAVVYPQKRWIIPVLVILITFIGVGKDLLHAFVIDYNFYLSESLLFGAFWPLFVPMIWLLNKLFRRSKSINLVVLPLLFTGMHLMIFSFLVYSLSALFYYHTFAFGPVFMDTFGDNGLACLLIYGATAFNFSSKKGKKFQSREDKYSVIQVNHKDKKVCLPIHKVLYIQTERPYIALIMEDGKYLHHATLKAIKEKHLSDDFIQIHKSTIINKNFIQSSRSRGNGDYDVFMTNGDQVRVSRNYSEYFKSHSRSSG